MTEYYIVSQRHTRNAPAQGCLIEFEDVIAECCNAHILTPRLGRKSLSQKLLKPKGDLAFSTEVPPRTANDTQILIIIDLDMNSLPEILASIPHWRSRFDLVCAYVFDAFIPASEYAKTSWQRQFSSYSRLISSLDYLFIPMTASLEDFQELYQIPVAMIPIACDVKKFANNKDDERYIDVLGYGRQNQEHGKVFSEVYNHPQSSRIYYHTDHMHIGKIHDFYAHRRLFWKILNHSRIALAYDVMRADPQKKFTFSFVGQRWFECLTAGCLIVGNRPKCPEMNDLFFWEDATIEIPDNSQDIIPFIEALLADKERLAAAHQRNREMARTHHDWRHRLKQIHACLKLPLPPQLEKDLLDLSRTLN